MDKIGFPNKKGSAIEYCNLSLEGYKELLKVLFQQTDFALNCHYIGDRIYTKLSQKYKHLENKWYIYALNSLDDEMIYIIIKLYNGQKEELSLFNILSYFAIEENVNAFFTTPEKRQIFKNLVDDYNNKCSDLRKKLITRRNNWQVHISRAILDGDKFKNLINLNTNECFRLLCYAFHTIRKLYKTLFDEEIPIDKINHFSTYKEIDKFFSALDDNGNLK